MARLFGTDGVRGVANEELTPALAMQLGQAGAYVLTKETEHKPIGKRLVIFKCHCGEVISKVVFIGKPIHKSKLLPVSIGPIAKFARFVD